MFYNCINLKTIYVGENWTTANVVNGSGMFAGCNNLTGGRGTSLDENHVDESYAHIDGGADNPGYLTSIADNADVAEVSFSRNGLELTLECSTENVEIYYNFSTESSDVWHKYTAPITLSEDCIVTAYAKRPSGISSAQTSYTFSMSDVQKVDTPTSSWNGDELILSCATDGATIYYTNSAEPVSSVTGGPTIHTYDQPIEVTQDAVFEVWATKSGMVQSDTLIIDYNYTAWNALREAIDNAKAVASQAATSENVTDEQRAELASKISTAEAAYAARTGSVDEITQITNELIVLAETVNHYVQAVDEPYAVLSDENTKLTFYYDKKKEERGGWDVGPFGGEGERGWSNAKQSIITVVFDESFADCNTIRSTAYWFEGFKNLTSFVGLENLKTDNVISMISMFENCEKLTSLDLSTFNTSMVTYMDGMFNGASSLKTIYVGNNWVTANASTMFYGCTSLVGGAGTTYNASEVGSTYARIDDPYNDKPGYFTDKYGVILIAKDYTREYGDENPTFEYMTKGVSISGEPTITCEATATSDVGTYPIVISYTPAGGDASTNSTNLNVTCVNGTLTITKAPMTIHAKDTMIVRGSEMTGFELDYTGLKNNENSTVLITQPTVSTTATSVSDVGTYQITVYGAEAKNYDIAYEMGTLTITKSKLTVTAKSYTIKRGEELPIFEVEYSGYVNNETDAVLTKKAIATCEAKSDTLPGTYQIRVSGAEAKNYEMEYVKGSLTITDDVVVIAKSYTREYGEPNPIFEYTSEGAILEGTPAIICEATATSPVGTYDIIISKGYITNSEVTYVKGTLTITKAPLIVTAKSYTIKRGSELPTFEVEYTGFKNNETDDVFAKKPVVTCEANSYTQPGIYQIVVSGAEAQNYEMEYVNGALTITDDAVVTAKSYTREYGEANPVFEYTVDGATLVGTPTITCEATATSPVGTYDIIITRGDITNSQVTFVKGTLTITKAPLTITAKSYTIKQGKDLPTLEVEYSGFKNNETDMVFTTKPTVMTRATKNSNPGKYDIYVYGAEAGNYNISYVYGTLTITEKTETFEGSVLTVKEGGNIDDAFESIGGREQAAKTITAIIWNAREPLTMDMLRGIDNPNMLIYVTDEQLAPSGVNNVVVNGMAKSIVLTDPTSDFGNYNFYCPQEFTAENISYTREFRQTTEINVSRGWESIALPFDVQTYTHEVNGEIAPFRNDASIYHFWLHQITDEGCVTATSIEANKPYIISMPNNETYTQEFNLAGKITFASTDVTIPATETRDIWLGDTIAIIPTFQRVEQNEMVYALNVLYEFDDNKEGSVFVSNYRDVRPFEVYTFHEPNHNGNAGARVINVSSLFGDDDTTDIIDVMRPKDSGIVSIYRLDGTLLKRGKSNDIINNLPKGIYIVNGKKMVVK